MSKTMKEKSRLTFKKYVSQSRWEQSTHAENGVAYVMSMREEDEVGASEDL